MIELIGKISKGTKMDQIYIPKNRNGFVTGEYVLISSLINKLPSTLKPRLYFYNTFKLEPIKIKIIEEVISLIEKISSPENIIITGSFLEKGFGFNDIDILILNEKEINLDLISHKILESLGIKSHIIQLTNKTLSAGLSTDPLYSMMLSKYISKKRLIFNVKRKINYKILDLNLLKSKTLIKNFDILNGTEKYYFTMNMVSIFLFIQGKKITKEIVNKEIEKIFNVKISEIKENLLDKNFLKIFEKIFEKTFDLILDSIKRG